VALRLSALPAIATAVKQLVGTSSNFHPRPQCSMPMRERPTCCTEGIASLAQKAASTCKNSGLHQTRQHDAWWPVAAIPPCCSSSRKGHWLTLYRKRFPSDAPPIEMRVMTRDRPQAAQLSDDIPNYKTHNGKFMWKLLTARIAMLFGR